jgi:PucR family transcriptional regulator, purine catabolism regulatory protein
VALTIADVLALDPFIEAEAEVVSGTGTLGRHVRWVHSSEIYEMAPLLSGGELLLTTGLGLAGADAGARRHYIREIAERGVAAVAFEVGRTFPAIPAELVDESRKRSLPLIVLHQVVPFIRMSEVANTAIVHDNARRLALMADLSADLDHAIIAGDGIQSLLAIGARTMHAPLALVAENGILVSTHGIDDESTARQLAAYPKTSVTLEIRGHPWGRLCAGAAAGFEAGDVAVLLERLALAVTLSLLGTGIPPGDSERQAAALLDDLLAGGNIASTDFTVRAGLAGFHPPANGSLVTVAVESRQAAPALALIDEAAARLGAPALRARVRGEVMGIMSVHPLADPFAAVLHTLSAARQAQSGEVNYVIVGSATQVSDTPARLARSLTDTRDTLALTRTVPSCFRRRPPVVTIGSMAMELHLSRLSASHGLDPAIAELVCPVIAWDRQHGSSLLSTLEVHLRCGCSATRTAEALYLGRHAVYQRLQRIESLLGWKLGDPDLHPALLLAACAARLQTEPHQIADSR